jgi:hypothetical protein
MRNDEAGTVFSRWEAQRRIADAWPYERRLCCEDATFVHCVCRISVRCPRHGIICVGSHD